MPHQLREASPFGHHPKHLIIDNDSKYGEVFVRIGQRIRRVRFQVVDERCGVRSHHLTMERLYPSHAAR